MSFERLYGLDDQREAIPYLDRFDNRAGLLKRLREAKVWDITVVGGGIHGAAFAHLAALNGFRTLLLEIKDFASGTSSRSSKMIHGGLRYLELFDFGQVFEGIKARENLFRTAGHLVKPQEFIFPVSSFWQRLKVGLGLKFYDWFNKGSAKHRWDKKNGGFVYSDGLTHDSRLVIEQLIAAREEGALCLNHLSFDNYRIESSGTIVGWTDQITGERGETRTGMIVNCAGPYVASAGRVKPGPLSSKIVFSRGSHLIFDKEWQGPARILPTGKKAGYYFVWPFGSCTLVGTTEEKIDQPDWDPQASAAELEELMERVKRDLPESGLTEANLVYSFAGIRTLPLREKAGPTTAISRKHIWSYSDGMLSLLGGKLTTFAWTVKDGLQAIYKLGHKKTKVTGTETRILPGYVGFEKATTEFRKIAEQHEIPAAVITSVISRLGSRVRHLASLTRGLELVGGQILRGEIEMAVRVEQALSLEDMLSRRLCLELTADQGLAVAHEIALVMAELISGFDATTQTDLYVSKVKKVIKLLKNNK